MKDIIYLDYGSATPLDPMVKKAMDEVTPFFANPSAASSVGRAAHGQLEAARREVAMALGAKTGEVIFTSGGTEADNLAILGIARANASGGKHILTTPIEHKAVLEGFTALKREGFEVEMIKVDKTGLVDLADLERKIKADTTLISIGLANSEIGTIQPIGEVAKIVAQIKLQRQKKGSKTPLYLHSDASAAAGQLSLAVSRLGVDALSLNAAKIYGPKGSGALYLRSGVKLAPVMVGGGQENGHRAGTENLAGAVGLAVALKLAERNRVSEVKVLTQLRDDLIKKLLAAYPKAILNGSQKKRLAGNINISFPGVDGEDLVARLDAAGIIVATGAACAAADEEPSYVIRALGRSREFAQGSLRITLGRDTNQAQLDILERVLQDLLGNIRAK